MNLKERAKKLKTDIPTAFLAMKSKEIPVIAKIIASITVGYALSPIDLIPDCVPVIGYLDDLILLPTLILITMKLVPKEAWNKCRAEAENIWADGKPKSGIMRFPLLLSGSSVCI